MMRHTRRHIHRRKRGVGGGFKNTMRRVCKGMSCMGNRAVQVNDAAAAFPAAAAPTPRNSVGNRMNRLRNKVTRTNSSLNTIYNTIKPHYNRGNRSNALKTMAARYTALKNAYKTMYGINYTRRNKLTDPEVHVLAMDPNARQAARQLNREMRARNNYANYATRKVLQSGRNVFENFKPAPTMRIAKGAFNHVNSLTNNELNEIRGYTAVPAVPANEHEAVNEPEPEHPEPGTPQYYAQFYEQYALPSAPTMQNSKGALNRLNNPRNGPSVGSN